MSNLHTGRCACGSLTYRVTGPLRDVWNCHCERCRRFTGHHMAATAARPEDLETDGDTLTWWYPVPGVAYGFCQACGSSLFWRADAHPEKISITAGSLDQPSGLQTTRAWWVAEAGDYFERDRSLIEFDRES